MDDDEEEDEQDSGPSGAGVVENGFGASRHRRSGNNPWHRTGITHHEYHSYIDSTLECRSQSVSRFSVSVLWLALLVASVLTSAAVVAARMAYH
jgi:hypothetical protein